MVYFPVMAGADSDDDNDDDSDDDSDGMQYDSEDNSDTYSDSSCWQSQNFTALRIPNRRRSVNVVPKRILKYHASHQ